MGMEVACSGAAGKTNIGKLYLSLYPEKHPSRPGEVREVQVSGNGQGFRTLERVHR